MALFMPFKVTSPNTACRRRLREDVDGTARWSSWRQLAGDAWEPVAVSASTRTWWLRSADIRCSSDVRRTSCRSWTRSAPDVPSVTSKSRTLTWMTLNRVIRTWRVTWRPATLASEVGYVRRWRLGWCVVVFVRLSVLSGPCSLPWD